MWAFCILLKFLKALQVRKVFVHLVIIIFCYLSIQFSINVYVKNCFRIQYKVV